MREESNVISEIPEEADPSQNSILDNSLPIQKSSSTIAPAGPRVMKMADYFTDEKTEETLDEPCLFVENHQEPIRDNANK